MSDDTVTMPVTLEEACARLVDLNGLLTARQWELAAIVATVVEPGTGGPKLGRSAQFLTARDFAALKIRGLCSHHSVVRYVNAWMNEVGRRPEPGEVIELPTRPWEEARQEPAREPEEESELCATGSPVRDRQPVRPKAVVLDDQWASWLRKGAALAERTEHAAEVGPYATTVLKQYRALAESTMDAEIHQLMKGNDSVH